MSRKILGLDIRRQTLSAVLMESSIKGHWIDEYRHISIPEPKDEPLAISDALDRAIDGLDLSGAVCSVSLPADLFCFRSLLAPFREKKKIEQILPLELEPVLPFPVDSMVIDFRTLPTADNDESAQLLASGIEAATLRTYTDLLSARQLRPKTITVGGCAIAHCLNRLADTPEDWLLLDIDSVKVTLIGVGSGEICLVRSLGPASDDTPSADELAEAIHHTLAGYEETGWTAFQPEVVWVSGAVANGANLLTELHTALPLPVKQVDLTDYIRPISRGRRPSPEEAASIGSSLALSLDEAEGIDGFNFRKGPFAEIGFWVENKKELIRTGIFALAAFFLFAAYHLFDAYLINQRIAKLDRQIVDVFKGTFPQINTIVDPLKQMEGELKTARQKALIIESPDETVRAIDVLNEISLRVPEQMDVQLTRLVIGDGTVQITGDTDTFNAVDSIKSQLEGSGLFKTVTIATTNLEKAENRVRFKLKVEL